MPTLPGICYLHTSDNGCTFVDTGITLNVLTEVDAPYGGSYSGYYYSNGSAIPLVAGATTARFSIAATYWNPYGNPRSGTTQVNLFGGGYNGQSVAVVNSNPPPPGSVSGMTSTSSLTTGPFVEVLAGGALAADTQLFDYAFVEPTTLSASSSLGGGAFTSIPLAASSAALDITLQAAAMDVATPDPVALSGSLDYDVSLLGRLSLYFPPPPVTPNPPPPPPPPPVPPPAYFDDGGTIPLLPAGRVLVSVYKPDATTLIAHVPLRKGVQWLDEMNATGTGSFQIHLDDKLVADHPDLLDQFNIVKFSIKGRKVKAWIIEDVNPTRVSSGEAADRWVTVSGRGALAALESAVIYPEYGVRATSPEVRHFDFASKEGSWRVASEWFAPSGVLWTADTTARRTYPTGWPDPLAYWLWSSSPLATAPAGRNWFRASFTLTEKKTGLLYIAADNVGSVYLDGQMVGSTEDIAWGFTKLVSFPVTLVAGDHTVAVWVDNHASSLMNPGGMLLTIMDANAVGEVTTDNIFRTTPSNTIVKAYGDAPGWHAANMLDQLVKEAQDRLVEAVLPITIGFQPDRDTDGKLWVDRQDRTANVGTTDLLDLATQLIEVSMDIEMTPDMVLNAWIRRGLDYSQDIKLLPGRDVTEAAATVRGGRVKNQALLKSGSGWVELSSPSSKDEYGRRETGLSVGNAGSTDQLINVGVAALQEVSRPEATIPLSYTSIRGPQPYEDFNLGDVISVPQEFKGMTPARLMSIAGSEQETSIQWDLDFYPHNVVDVIDQVVVGIGENSDPDGLYQSEVLSDSPWGFWRLKETTGTKLADISGRNAHMTIINGGATLNQTGPVNKAVAWSSAAGYATPGANFLFASSAATLEVWVNLPSIPLSTTTVFGQAVGGVNGTSHDKEILIDTQGRVVWYVHNGAPQILTAPTPLELNTWYHIVCSVGADGMKIYVDSVITATKPSVTSSYTTKMQYVLLHAGGNTYNGQGAVSVAEPAIYFQQLFDSRIESHFNALTL